MPCANPPAMLHPPPLARHETGNRSAGAPGRPPPASRARAWLLCALIGLAALPPAARAQQRYWYDGDQRRALWSDQAVVADFSARSAEKASVLKPPALAKGEAALHSPVFRDAKDGAGAQRALPGGVIVRVDPALSDEQRAALFARHGLLAVRELGEGTGAWLVRSPPGLPSLDLANRLYESGDFVAASPNWWRPRALK